MSPTATNTVQPTKLHCAKETFFPLAAPAENRSVFNWRALAPVVAAEAATTAAPLPVYNVALAAPVQTDHLSIVLVSTRNPLNIGAAARAMSNFGFDRLRVVQPYEIAFREARSAVGAPDLLRKAQEFRTLAEAVADCALVVGTTAASRRELHHPLLRLQEGARRIRKQLPRGRVALLFGSEKRGLANEDLSHCHWLMRIPTREQHGAMNLGQAVAVCLYEIVRTAKAPIAQFRRQRATAGDMERVTMLLFDVLCASGYVKPRSAAAKEEKLRRMLRRLDLSRDDAELLLGMLRQITWTLRASPRHESGNEGES